MKSRYSFFVCLALAAGMSNSAFAQAPATGAATAPAPAATGHKIAIVDIAQIYKNHVLFTKELEAIKAKSTGAEAKLKGEFEQMKAMVEQLKGMQPSSPDYRNLEANIARREMDFKLSRQNMMKDIMDQESQLYYRLYLQIDDTVKRYAQHYGYALVLRHTTDPIKEDDRNEIMRGINKPIVFVRNDLDITQGVLQFMNANPVPLTGGPPVNNSAARPAAPGQQPR